MLNLEGHKDLFRVFLYKMLILQQMELSDFCYSYFRTKSRSYEKKWNRNIKFDTEIDHIISLVVAWRLVEFVGATNLNNEFFGATWKIDKIQKKKKQDGLTWNMERYNFCFSSTVFGRNCEPARFYCIVGNWSSPHQKFVIA